jgi:nucleoside-diphosphate-sugar epimerase
MSVRLITGATGFVGGAVVLELLDRTGDRILGLVRGRDGAQARARLHGALEEMAEGYGRPDLIAAVRERTDAVPGDILAPACGADPAALPRVDEFWHVAASLRYKEKDREEIEAANVGGTAHALELAGLLGVPVFNYVSTGYVAGARRGIVPEGPVLDPALANNCYEETKIRAEQLVEAAAENLRVRILRPTIVVGHSRTRHGLNWSGLYGFARQLLVFQELVRPKVGTLLSHTRLRLVSDPFAPINLVPVDLVARNAVTIALSRSPAVYFHLGNSVTPIAREVVAAVMRLTGLREPLWVRDKDDFTAIDDVLDKGMGFYGSYYRYGKRFDLSNTETVCGPGSCAAPMDAAQITEYVRHYLAREPELAGKAGRARVLHAVAA